jgi:hypothetical protein
MPSPVCLANRAVLSTQAAANWGYFSQSILTDKGFIWWLRVVNPYSPSFSELPSIVWNGYTPRPHPRHFYRITNGGCGCWSRPYCHVCENPVKSTGPGPWVRGSRVAMQNAVPIMLTVLAVRARYLFSSVDHFQAVCCAPDTLFNFSSHSLSIFKQCVQKFVKISSVFQDRVFVTWVFNYVLEQLNSTWFIGP